MGLAGVLKDPRWGLGRRLVFGAVIGLATGLAAVGFRQAFEVISDFLLHTGGEGVAQAHPALLFFVPALGGLAVGLLTWAFFGKGAGIPGVADVILAQTRDRGIMSFWAGLKASASTSWR